MLIYLQQNQRCFLVSQALKSPFPLAWRNSEGFVDEPTSVRSLEEVAPQAVNRNVLSLRRNHGT